MTCKLQRLNSSAISILRMHQSLILQFEILQTCLEAGTPRTIFRLAHSFLTMRSKGPLVVLLFCS